MNLHRNLTVIYKNRLHANSRGYLREFAFYLLLVFIAAAADFVSTYQFMTMGSVDDEFHPGIRFVSQLAGPFFGPLLGKTCQLAALIFLTILFRPWAKGLF